VGVEGGRKKRREGRRLTLYKSVNERGGSWEGRSLPWRGGRGREGTAPASALSFPPMKNSYRGSKHLLLGGERGGYFMKWPKKEK